MRLRPNYSAPTASERDKGKKRDSRRAGCVLAEAAGRESAGDSQPDPAPGPGDDRNGSSPYAHYNPYLFLIIFRSLFFRAVNAHRVNSPGGPDLSLILFLTVELNAWDFLFGLFAGFFVSFAASSWVSGGRETKTL